MCWFPRLLCLETTCVHAGSSFVGIIETLVLTHPGIIGVFLVLPLLPRSQFEDILEAPAAHLTQPPSLVLFCFPACRSEFEGILEKTPAEANAFLSDPEKYIASECGTGKTLLFMSVCCCQMGGIIVQMGGRQPADGVLIKLGWGRVLAPRGLPSSALGGQQA